MFVTVDHDIFLYKLNRYGKHGHANIFSSPTLITGSSLLTSMVLNPLIWHYMRSTSRLRIGADSVFNLRKRFTIFYGNRPMSEPMFVCLTDAYIRYYVPKITVTMKENIVISWNGYAVVYFQSGFMHKVLLICHQFLIMYWKCCMNT